MERSFTFVLAGALATTACSTSTPPLNVRATTTGLAAGENTAAAQIALARGQLALGSVALALEGFRRAVRLDASSVEAMMGVADCYDRMGRFDVSRIYYEKALAAAPSDERIYARLATSLEQQGLLAEALALRGELAGRRVASKAEVPLAAPVVAAAEGAGDDLASTLSTSVMVQALADIEAPSDANVPMPAQPTPKRLSDPRVAIRLERLNLHEVALVTSAAPPLRVIDVQASRALQRAQLAATRPPRRPQLLLLNAARLAGLAARTREKFARKGWEQVLIGNAPRVLARSELRYAADRKAEAQRLGRQLGVPVRLARLQAGRMTLLLGKDSVRLRLPS